MDVDLRRFVVATVPRLAVVPLLLRAPRVPTESRLVAAEDVIDLAVALRGVNNVYRITIFGPQCCMRGAVCILDPKSTDVVFPSGTSLLFCTAH